MQPTAIRPVLLALITLLGIFSASFNAARADFKQLFEANSSTSSFLPVEEAFRFTGRIHKQTALIEVKVTPGHYLYQHRFGFSPVSNIKQLGKPVYPTGEIIFDPYYKKDLETFSQDFTVQIPIEYSGNLPEVDIAYQGCATAGLCYPPNKVTIPLITGEGTEPTFSGQTSIESPTDSENQYQNTIESHGLLVGLLLFVLAGIGLSLTPCVLPMIPILSSMVIGAKGLDKRRAVGLTLTYILSMAGTFAIAGTLTGLFGASLNLQAKLQSPWLLVPMAMLFVVLALSLFGLYELQLPQRIRDRLSGGSKQPGSFSGAAIMGLLSALVVSPCVSAPLAGALIYISTTGDALFGGLSLFALGLGMGIPLFIIALGGRQWLPKAGPWMNSVRAFFGVLLLGVAIWMLERILPAPLTLFLWGALAMGCAVFLRALNTAAETPVDKIKQIIGLICMIYGTALLIGAAMNNRDPLAPLALSPQILSQETTEHPGNSLYSTSSSFTNISTVEEMKALLSQAKVNSQAALVDFYADWCISCKIMERTVFPDPLVTEQLAKMTLIKLDITENTAEHQALLNQYRLFGPPALLFFNTGGEEVPSFRTQGEVTANQLHQKLTRLLNSP
ncbi:MAG: protein-disulfide reductase DsbD [Endozoicomonas sp.]